MVTRRAGHTLPELIIAVVFLAGTVGAVGASALLGYRWTERGRQHQEAVRRAGALLDSLATSLAPAGGVMQHGPLRLAWSVDDGPDGGHRLEVQVTDARGAEILRIGGIRRVPPPVLGER